MSRSSAGSLNYDSDFGTFVDTTGYESKDVDEALAPQLAQSRGIAGIEARWESTLDCQRCCRQLNEMGFEVYPPLPWRQ